MQLPMEEDKMGTTTQHNRLIATVFVLALGALTFGASGGMAAPHEPKAGFGSKTLVSAGLSLNSDAPQQVGSDPGRGGEMAARRHPTANNGGVSTYAGVALTTGASRGVHDVEIVDPAHRALVENARRHGLKVRNVKPTGSRPAYVASVSTTSKVTAAAGGFSWTYPGVLAGLVLAFALAVGGLVLVARRLRSRTVTV
jgi:hypothetical protein